MHDMKGNILSVNPAAAASLGYAVQDMMGHSLADFMRASDVWIMDAYLERIEAAGIDTGILRLVTHDGELRSWEYRNVLDDDGDQAYVLGYAQDVTDRERIQRELRERSVRDPLTGCRNRAYLADLAERMRPDEAFACIVVDLDRFKQVNDTFGHHRGDEVLVQMGQFLTRYLRPEDVVTRVGGDEFLAILMGADELVTRNISRRLLENKAAAPNGFTLGSAVRRPKQALVEVWAEADRKLYESRSRRD
jgi:diguanylate cyclase (GGDEF)-like protein/PAS domain S-box-containing protein